MLMTFNTKRLLRTERLNKIPVMYTGKILNFAIAYLYASVQPYWNAIWISIFYWMYRPQNHWIFW